jgi:hypothetical protein
MDLSTFGRSANALLGAWLFVSAFVLPRSVDRATSAGLVGSVIVAAAIAALYTHPRVRFVNAGAAVWLFLSTFALPSGLRVVVAHDLAVAALVLGFALVPSPGPRAAASGRA